MSNRKGHYEPLGDDGCEVNPVPHGCLECPLPGGCRYDSLTLMNVALHWNSDARIMASWEPGMKAVQVARLHGVTTRTIYRVRVRWQQRIG